MANPTPPPVANTSASDQIDLRVRRTSSVNVDGVNYDYSFEGTDRLSDAIVINLIKLHLTASGKSSLDKIDCTLKKSDLSSVSSGLQTSEVEYLSKTGEKKTKNVFAANGQPVKPLRKLSADTPQKIESYWRAIQNDLQAITSGTPSPAQSTPISPTNSTLPNNNPAASAQLIEPANSSPAPAPAPVNPPVVETPRNVIAPYVNRAKRLPKLVGSSNQFPVNLAVENQLTRAPGQTQEPLVNNYRIHIEDNRAHYSKQANFSEILKDLKTACANNSQLTDGMFPASTGLLFQTSISKDAFDVLLRTQDVDVLCLQLNLPKEKVCEIIINIYIQCLPKGIALSEKLFLEAFIDVAKGQKPNQKLFNIMVIDHVGAQKSSYRWDGSSTPIDTDERCLFLCVDDQGRYQSIPRDRKQFALGETLTGAPISDDRNNNRDVSNELGILIDLYDSYENLSLKDYILGQGSFQNASNLPSNYPQVFDRLKRFIYEHDRISNTHRNIPQGLQNQNYGQLALEAMSPADLETLLVNNREKVLAVGRNPGVFHGATAF